MSAPSLRRLATLVVLMAFTAVLIRVEVSARVKPPEFADYVRTLRGTWLVEPSRHGTYLAYEQVQFSRRATMSLVRSAGWHITGREYHFATIHELGLLLLDCISPTFGTSPESVFLQVRDGHPLQGGVFVGGHRVNRVEAVRHGRLTLSRMERGTGDVRGGVRSVGTHVFTRTSFLSPQADTRP